MPAIVEHWADISTVIIMVVSIAITWTKVRDKIDTLSTAFRNCQSHCLKELENLDNKITSGTEFEHINHGEIWKSISEHHENPTLHVTEPERVMQTEWRQTVLARFDRLERLLLRLNGGEK